MKHENDTGTHHGDDVSEPLMGELVADDDGDRLLGHERRVLRVVQESSLTVGDETPALT